MYQEIEEFHRLTEAEHQLIDNLNSHDLLAYYI